MSACAFVLLSMTGCHQDMWNQPKYKSLGAGAIFENAQSSRPMVVGTVPYKGARTDDKLYKGKEDGQFVATNPLEINEALIRRGQERFDIYCAVCHGKLGFGNDTAFVATRGFETKKPANFHEQRLRDMPPGYFFDVISNGFGVMYPYASRIPDVNDRWAIVAYINVLQYSQNAPKSDLPEDKWPLLDLSDSDRTHKYMELTGQLPAAHGEGH
jgi:mono/diheme cytochrome c family protein